jgi:hypothetical protein
VARPLEEEHDHDDFDSFVVPLPEIADPAALAARVTAVADTHDVFRDRQANRWHSSDQHFNVNWHADMRILRGWTPAKNCELF